MCPLTFSERWPELYSFSWTRLLNSQSYIERLSQNEEIVDVEEIKIEVDNEAQEEREAVYQLDFELFSLLSARVSSELTGSNNGVMARFLEPVLQNFNTERWQHAAWTKFVLILIVCNGGAANIA